MVGESGIFTIDDVNGFKTPGTRDFSRRIFGETRHPDVGIRSCLVDRCKAKTDHTIVYTSLVLKNTTKPSEPPFDITTSLILSLYIAVSFLPLRQFIMLPLIVIFRSSMYPSSSVSPPPFFVRLFYLFDDGIFVQSSAASNIPDSLSRFRVVPAHRSCLLRFESNLLKIFLKRR